MKNKLIKAAGYLVTLAAFAFLVKAVLSMHVDLAEIRNPFAAIACGLLLSAGYCCIVYFSSYAWKLVLEYIHGAKIAYSKISGVYAKANMGKYFPGNVMHFAGRNILAGKLGISQFDIAFSRLIEVLTLSFTAVLWSLMLASNRFIAFITGALKSANKLLYSALGIVFILLIVGAVMLGFKKSGFFQKYKQFFKLGFLKLLLILFCIYSITMIIPGLFLAVILGLVLGSSIPLATLPIILSAYTISWVAGFIVPGAPGGIGVRESIMLLLLSPFFSRDIVFLAAIILRLTSILGDAAAFFVHPLVLKLPVKSSS